ncbi:MAG: glycosyltransferase family 4 protein [Candidatus Eisenbacteria bacterium]
MRALVIAPQPFFTARGTPFSVYYRTLALAGQGVEADILTYGDGEDVDIPGVVIHRIPRFPFLGPVKIGPSFLKLFLDAVLFGKLLWMLLGRRYSFVHAHEEGVFLALLLKPVFRYKLVYDMHSSLPQQLVNFRFTGFRPLIGLFERLEKLSLRHADAVIVVCPDLVDIARREGVEDSKLFLIENSIYDEVNLASNAGAGAGLPELPAKRPLVMYVGTFEAYQGIDLLLRSFGKVVETIPGAHLVLVGGTPDQVSGAAAMAAGLGLDGRVSVHERVPQRTAHKLLESADLLVSPRVSGTNTPLKVYEILGRGIPLVATRILSHTQVLRDDVCVLVDPTPEAISDGIVALLRDPERRERLSAAGRELYRARYSREAYDEKTRALLRVIS